MGFFRSLLILLGVFFSCLALLVPFLALDVPLAGEAWVIQSISELHRNFRLVPTLNGIPLHGPNPLMTVLFSLLPVADIAALRLVNILFGCLAALAVFSFSTSQWNVRSGVFSALITMTSWGFIASHATLNLTAVPAVLAVISFLLFAQVYLKGQAPGGICPPTFSQARQPPWAAGSLGFSSSASSCSSSLISRPRGSSPSSLLTESCSSRS